jgi:hypothetical protein
MDGRDLSNDIYPQWTQDCTILEVAHAIPKFISRVLSAKTYHFYGKFHVGSIYDLKNFNNMLVNNFNCKIEQIANPLQPTAKKTTEIDYVVILSDDAFILFEVFENNPHSGKIVFWSTLYAITDMQVNKMQKIASLSFYNDENNTEKQMKLRIDNILFFREALVKRMHNLKVGVESKKLIKGQHQEKRLTNREINIMNIEQIVENIEILKTKILINNQVNYYTVNTFTVLCGKAIEYYSAINDERHITYLTVMKEVLQREDVQKITSENMSVK